MGNEKREARVRCHHCGKVFPVVAAASQEERHLAEAILKRGDGTLRVARWCPFCEETNMLDLTCSQLEIVHMEVVFQRHVDPVRGGVPAEWEKKR